MRIFLIFREPEGHLAGLLAIAITGELVLPEVIVGMIEASTTLRPPTP